MHNGNILKYFWKIYRDWSKPLRTICSIPNRKTFMSMGLLPDTQKCGLCMRRECWERFPRHWFQRKLLVSDPGMHHGTCVTHVPWCMSGSLTRGGGENVPGIPGACATSNFAYLARGPWVSNRSISLPVHHLNILIVWLLRHVAVIYRYFISTHTFGIMSVSCETTLS